MEYKPRTCARLQCLTRTSCYCPQRRGAKREERRVSSRLSERNFLISDLALNCIVWPKSHSTDIDSQSDILHALSKADLDESGGTMVPDVEHKGSQCR